MKSSEKFQVYLCYKALALKIPLTHTTKAYLLIKSVVHSLVEGIKKIVRYLTL